MLNFKNVNLSISPINWSNDDDIELGKNTTFLQCIKEMSQSGYKGTEVGNKYPKEPKILLKALNRYNLTVSSAWMSTYFTQESCYEKTLKDFIHFMSFMKSVGGSVINICECGASIQKTHNPIFSNRKPYFSDNQFRLLVRGLHDIGRIAYDHNIKISYHYHLGTGIQNYEEVKRLMDNTCPDLVGLLLDTGHAYASDINIMRLLYSYGERVNQVHLKDVRKKVIRYIEKNNQTFMQGVRSGMFTVPGDGDINFHEIFDSLSKLSYEGWFVVEAEQDPSKANPLEYALKARSFIKQLTNI